MVGDNGHAGFHPGFEHPEPQRIVSLVPSITESLFELGLGPRVVGITDYCVHPAAALEGLPHLGGPKNPQIEALIALKPDLVIANQEENTPQTVEALQAAGVRVWLTFPQSVAEAMDVLWALVRIQPDDQAVMRLRVLEQALTWTEEAAASQDQPRYFCPIWFEATADGIPWWMVFNRHTYAHDLFALVGGENIFAARERRYPLEADLGRAAPADPGERDTRYPRVTLDEIRAGDPQVILLPGEPFPFTQQHLAALADLLPETAAVRTGRLHLVDGSLITWHGVRLGLALQELPKYFVTPSD
jgi:iron complex transport system substrate-binding protein